MVRTPTEGELEGLRRHFEIERELAAAGHEVTPAMRAAN